MSIKDFFKTTVFILIVFWLIKIFDISYPINITTRTKSAELAVVGQGKIDVSPDIFYVSAGVVVDNKKTVKEVQDQIDDINSKIINLLKSYGLSKENLKTTNYSINPKYSYDKDGNNQIISYLGSVNLRVKVKDLSLLSKIIEGVILAGANEIYGISYEIDNPDKFQEQARKIAIENAKSQAKKLASNLGIRLSKITNIVEGQPGDYQPIAAPMTGGGGLEKSVVIEPGTQTITSTVTLYFEKR
ncbi:MAG: hypothetical protein Fur009_0570 [Candidatus Microgenomates bacterium]